MKWQNLLDLTLIVWGFGSSDSQLLCFLDQDCMDVIHGQPTGRNVGPGCLDQITDGTRPHKRQPWSMLFLMDSVTDFTRLPPMKCFFKIHHLVKQNGKGVHVGLEVVVLASRYFRSHAAFVEKNWKRVSKESPKLTARNHATSNSVVSYYRTLPVLPVKRNVSPSRDGVGRILASPKSNSFILPLASTPTLLSFKSR